MIRCKACGYIMKEGSLKDRCPACGAARTAFEPYTDPVGPRRRRILKLDLHPVGVHFATSFAPAVFVLAVAGLFFSGNARNMLVDSVKILALLWPFLIIGTILLGLLDGKIRFRKIGNSKILKTKIVYAVILFVIGSAFAAIVWADSFETNGWTAAAIVIAALGIALVYYLGTLGSTIRNAAFGGN